MRNALAVLSLLFVSISSHAAEPVYLDELMEMPLPQLQAQFPGLKKEGCYSVGGGRFLLIAVDRKEGKPWRIVLTAEAPCKRPDVGPAIEVRQRKGVQLGDSSLEIVEKLGRPDASAPPETALKRLGDLEYFYVCRVAEMCARHTSVFMRGGVTSAIAEWYSD